MEKKIKKKCKINMWSKFSRCLQIPDFFISLIIYYLGRYQEKQMWKQNRKYRKKRQFIWDTCINNVE